MDHLAYLVAPTNKDAAYADSLFSSPTSRIFFTTGVTDAKGSQRRPLRLVSAPTIRGSSGSINVNGAALGESGKRGSYVVLPIARMNLYFFELGIVILAVRRHIEKDPKWDRWRRATDVGCARAGGFKTRSADTRLFLGGASEANDLQEMPNIPVACAGGEGNMQGVSRANGYACRQKST